MVLVQLVQYFCKGLSFHDFRYRWRPANGIFKYLIVGKNDTHND